MGKKEDEILVKIWSTRTHTQFGGTIQDFIDHAEAELQPIIDRSKKDRNNALGQNAIATLKKIQDLKKR